MFRGAKKKLRCSTQIRKEKKGSWFIPLFSIKNLRERPPLVSPSQASARPATWATWMGSAEGKGRKRSEDRTQTLMDPPK